MTDTNSKARRHYRATHLTNRIEWALTGGWSFFSNPHFIKEKNNV
jgi:hypothetical protein